MEILPVSTLNSTAVGNNVGVHLSSSVVKATCSYFKLKDIFKSSIKEVKKAMSIQDIPLHALINKIFLKEHRVYDCKQIKILPAESQMNVIDPSVTITDSSATEYDLADESSVCSTSLPPLEKLAGAEPVSEPKTFKSILNSNSILKVGSLKAPAGKVKNVKTEDDIPLSVCDIRKPIWYLESGCSRHMTCVKSYLHKYVEQPGTEVVFGDDFRCTTKGYGSIKCNVIVFTKVAFVNGIKYNLISISQLCDAKYIVQFDEKKGIILNSNKEVVMIAPRVRYVYVLNMTSLLQQSCFFAKTSESLNWVWHKRLVHLNFKTINQLAKQNLVIGLPSLFYSKDKPYSSCEKGKHHRANFKTKQTSSIKKCLPLLHMDLFGPITLRSDNGTEFRNSILVNFCDENGISQNFSFSYTPKQNGIAKRKNKSLIEAARTMLSGSVFSKQYWTEAVATAYYTQNKSTIVKRHLKTPYEIFHGRLPNIDFLHVFGCPPSGSSIQEDNKLKKLTTSHLMKELKLLKYQVDSNVVQYIEPYEKPEPIVTEVDASFDQNDQAYQNDQMDQNDVNDQNDHHVQANGILTEDTSTPKTISIPTGPSISIPSMAYLAPQDRWSKDKHIKLVNIIGNLGVGMLTRVMAKELSAASTHVSLFVDFLSKEEPKKVFEALKHPGWVDVMQEELNQFAINKVWTLVHAPYEKTITDSKWVFRNKRDETGIVIKNKERLVAQGYSQQEGIDYDETFAPVTRLKEIRIFLAFSTYMNFIVYQMVVKSAFLNEKLKEEVYVKQPSGFESSEFPNHIFKLDKALYRLKQATRAWHETLSIFLTEHKFMRGKIDKHIIKQFERGISINQEKYVKDLLKKYDINGSSVKTPMVPSNNLGCDLNGKAINETQYRTISSTEAEYVAAAGCCAIILWMKSQLTDYDIIYEKVPIFCDNINAIAILNNPVLHSRTQHIGVTTFRNAIRENYLSYSSEYAELPSLETIREWFPTIGYSREIKAKGTLKRGFLPPRWRLLIGQIIQCLKGKTSGFDQISNKDAIILYCLTNGVDIDYARQIKEDIINKLNKKTREKVVPYPSVHNYALKKNKPEGPPFTDHMLVICNVDEPVVLKVPKTSSKDEKNQRRFLFKGDTGSPTGHSKKKKQSSLAKDSNPSQPPASTHVVAGLHKEAQQATGGPTSLGVITSTIIHSESASEYATSIDSLVEADPGKSAPNDSISQQKGIDKGTQNYTFDHIIAGTNPSFFKDEKEVSFGDDEFNTSPDPSRSDDAKKEIKIEDLSKLVQNVEVDFMDLDSPEDDKPIIVQDEDEEESHTEEIMMKRFMLNHIQNLKSLNSKLVKEKEVEETEAALLKAKPSFLNASATRTRGQVSSIQAKIKTLDAHPSLLTKVTEALDMFAQAIESASHKVDDKSVPLAGQAGTHPVEGEKNTRQATITQLFKQRDAKDAEKANLNTKPIIITVIPPITSPIIILNMLTGSMVESSKKKKLKKFDFVTEEGRYGVSVPALTKDHRGVKAQYAVSRETQYAVFKIWNEYNILEDIKRGPYSKKSPIRRIQYLDTPYRTDFQTL
ncbi:retrovirus-related pol polyprotein from transposon TNT 1-94 [Tanacetum coccineum]